MSTRHEILSNIDRKAKPNRTRLRLRKTLNEINPARVQIPSRFYCCHYSLKQLFYFLSTFTQESLKAHERKYRESLARVNKSKILMLYQKNFFRKLSSKKNVFNFQESIVFEKMRKNENSGFYLINYAKVRVKMTYFIASVPRQDSKL